MATDTLLYCVTYLRASVGLSSALWKNGGSDPDAVWHHRSDGSMDEAGSGIWGSVHGKGSFCFGHSTTVVYLLIHPESRCKMTKPLCHLI